MIYKVAQPVVELIVADSPKGAQRILRKRLEEAGFTPYDHETGPSVFESEFIGEQEDE